MTLTTSKGPWRQGLTHLTTVRLTCEYWTCAMSSQFLHCLVYYEKRPLWDGDVYTTVCAEGTAIKAVESLKALCECSRDTGVW